MLGMKKMRKRCMHSKLTLKWEQYDKLKTFFPLNNRIIKHVLLCLLIYIKVYLIITGHEKEQQQFFFS